MPFVSTNRSQFPILLPKLSYGKGVEFLKVVSERMNSGCFYSGLFVSKHRSLFNSVKAEMMIAFSLSTGRQAGGRPISTL